MCVGCVGKAPQMLARLKSTCSRVFQVPTSGSIGWSSSEQGELLFNGWFKRTSPAPSVRTQENTESPCLAPNWYKTIEMQVVRWSGFVNGSDFPLIKTMCSLCGQDNHQLQVPPRGSRSHGYLRCSEPGSHEDIDLSPPTRVQCLSGSWEAPSGRQSKRKGERAEELIPPNGSTPHTRFHWISNDENHSIDQPEPVFSSVLIGSLTTQNHIDIPLEHAPEAFRLQRDFLLTFMFING